MGHITITVLGKENLPPTGLPYDVTGPLCENNDKFAENRKNLPQVAIGDLLFIHDTGAHGYAMGYNYNGRLRHSELLLQTDGRVRLIRRAETIKDYLRTNMVDEDLRKALQNDNLILNDRAQGYDLKQPKFRLGNVYTYTPACDVLDNLKL